MQGHLILSSSHKGRWWTSNMCTKRFRLLQEKQYGARSQARLGEALYTLHHHLLFSAEVSPVLTTSLSKYHCPLHNFYHVSNLTMSFTLGLGKKKKKKSIHISVRKINDSIALKKKKRVPKYSKNKNKKNLLKFNLKMLKPVMSRHCKWLCFYADLYVCKHSWNKSR